jgi:hypothetical protein
MNAVDVVLVIFSMLLFVFFLWAIDLFFDDEEPDDQDDHDSY